MFENGPLDEIKTLVVTNLSIKYNYCVESACAVVRFSPKPKQKEALVEVKVKVKSNANVKEKSQGNQQKP